MDPRLTNGSEKPLFKYRLSVVSKPLDHQTPTMSTMETIRRLATAPAKDFPTHRDQNEAIKVCQTLLTKLQDPFQRVWEAVVDISATVAPIKLYLDHDLFRVWKESGNGDQSSHDLAVMVGLRQDEMLGKVVLSPSPLFEPLHPISPCTDRPGRILKHLAAHAVIEEVGVETYRPTAFSNAMLSSVTTGIEYL